MELRDLKALVSIAEMGSISGAAHKLNLTQPGLSALLRRLEDELGVRIMNRHSRGVALTVEGKYLLERAYRILNDVAETSSALREIAEEPVGTVRIGLPTSAASGLIPAFVPEILQRYPRIHLHIIEAMSGSLVELLQLGRLDMAMLFDVQPMPGLRSEPILSEEVRFLVRKGDPLANRRTVTLEEIAQHGVVLPSASHSIRQFVERAANAEGVRLKVDADVDSFSGLIGLVLAGNATILPPYLLMEEIRAGSIKAIRIEQPSMQWTLHLATRLDSVRPRAVMMVGRQLVEKCVGLVNTGAWPGKVHAQHTI
ncbi:MAG: LysR family transcriptional regulator [Stappiaceae bacterium]